MKIRDVALLTEGTIEGDENIDVLGMNGVETAGLGDLTFAMDEDKLSLAENSSCACILTIKSSRTSTKTLIRVNNPKLAFLIAYNALQAKVSEGSVIHPTAVIADSAIIGKNVHIGAHVAIGANVVIGDECRIHANVVLYEGAILKNRVVLHSGVVVGADGFGYIREEGQIYKFPQLGKVVIEDNVEIGANCTIDRGSLGCTVIGAGSKIDNLCHIAHNVKIGKNVIMAAQCGIAGSTVIGDHVTMSGQVAVIDNITVGKNVTIGGKSGVIGPIKDNAVVWGIPARDVGLVKRQMAVLGWITKNFSVFSKLNKDRST